MASALFEKAFAKRHYQKIAGILHRQIVKAGADSLQAKTIRDISFELAAWFSQDNPLFNPHRFQKAVETGKETR